ncbi:Uncharacterised protein [Legionella busanensis]|uniref:Uncharacterized protein n=1 Tax=Legionella busanensis TaxID=190655 RepID=A0A378JI23_9GAMM|nr:hypothetical protein [Legionella busanensis]STX50677.1 Uncharacterised protein [Legionella busanensis]
MKSVLDNLKVFNNYIKGERADVVKNELAYYKYNLDALKINFKEVIITDDEDIVEQVQNILANLNIPKSQWPSYIKRKNLYQFLEKLNRRGFIQISYLLQLIDEKTQIRKKNLTLAGFGALMIFLSSLFIPQLVAVRLALQSFILSTFSLPLLGLISKVFSTGYYLYNNHTDTKRTLLKRLHDNGFVVASFIVNFVAYVLWIIAASPMTPLIGGLFILASVLNVAKELFSLGHYAIKYIARDALPTTLDLNLYRSHIRNEYSYFNRRNSAFINLVAAILIVGIMAAWSFLPSGIILSVGTFVAIGIISLVKKLILDRSEKIIRDRLQLQLQHINEVEEKLTTKTPLTNLLSQEIVKEVRKEQQRESAAHSRVNDANSTPTYLLVKKLKFLFWQRPENITIPFNTNTLAPPSLK